MRYHFGAAIIALVSSASLALAQECPPGYEKSKLAWVDCPTSGNQALQCATIEVPLDWTTPNSNEKLKLRLVRQPAAANTPNAKSIIINPGGPGESGIKSVVDGGSGYQEVVGDGFHIIGFDPRGVGLTNPYACPEAVGDVGVYNTDSGLETAFQYNVAQAKDCADQKFGSNLIGTSFVARDIKAIAEATGEDDLIRYWGYSYGTLLGATLSAMFPDKMDRVILDGNINPTDYYRGLGEEGSADVDRGVARFFEQCAEAASPDCAVAVAGQTARQLQATFDTFLGKLAYDQAKQVRDVFYKVLYFQSATAYKDFATVLSGYYKNPDSINKPSLTSRQLDWDPDHADIKTELALSGITCGDAIQRPIGSAANFKKWLAIYQRTSKYGGDIAISILYQCSVWTANAKEKYSSSFSNIRTKNPILFLNTQYDPVTPLISAQNSAMGFVGARVLVSSGVGHCTNANESPELNEAIKTYMISGTLPSVNKIYQPQVTNVFRAVAKRTLNGPNLSKRSVDYPAILKKKGVVVKRLTDAIPGGCTKVAASLIPVVSASSTSVAVSSSPVMVSSEPHLASASSAPVSSASSSAPVSSASSSAIVSSSSSAIVSSSPSTAASSAPCSSLASTSHSASASPSSFSAARSSSTAHISISSYPVSSSDSASTPSLAPSTVGSSASSVSISATHHSGASTMPISTASPGSVAVTSSKIHVDGYNYDVAYSMSTKYSASPPSYPSSVDSNGQLYDSYYSTDAAVYGKLSTSTNGYNGYAGYEDDNRAIVTPYPTLAWYSQPGYVPITKLYTTMTVETITQCNRDNYCPLNTATPLLIVTGVKTITTVVAVPTTTVYVTSIIDVCSTGLITSTVTVTETCNAGCVTKPTGVAQGFSTTVKYCAGCATPSTVAVTLCTACIELLAKSTSPPALSQPTNPPSKASSVPTLDSPNKYMLPAVPSNSKPAGGTPSAPPKSTVPVGNNTIAIVSSMPSKTSTIQTRPVHSSIYRCLGSNCNATATYTPAQFTGAAKKAQISFVAPIIFTGFTILFNSNY